MVYGTAVLAVLVSSGYLLAVGWMQTLFAPWNFPGWLLAAAVCWWLWPGTGPNQERSGGSMELVVRTLSKQYPHKLAVDRVSLTLTPGIYGLLGANGAGGRPP